LRAALSARWRAVVVTTSCILVAMGATVSVLAFEESPAARIVAQGRADYARALAQALHASPARSVTDRKTPSTAWKPTLPGEVGTITISSLDVSAPILAETVSQGALVIPPDVHQVGWDDETPAPGSSGVSLLAGHVNWVGQGEGALGDIGELVPGDQVQVDWGGRETSWVVAADPELSPNTEVHPSLFTSAGVPRLALVTCGGPFSETAQGGSYADNVIVLASPEGAG